jgi:hypothetical protein
MPLSQPPRIDRNPRPGGQRKARVLLRDDSASSPRTTPGLHSRWPAALLCCSAALCLPRIATAGNDAEASAAPARRFSLELRAVTGGAALEHIAFEGPTIVELGAATLGVAARAGWFPDSHVQLGMAASVAKYWRAGKIHVRDAEAFNDPYWQFDDSPVLWAPFGAFIELYPTRERGFFFGVGAGLGYIPEVAHPRPNSIDIPMYTAGYSLEAGYDWSLSQRQGLGVLLRYAAWSGEESPLSTDYPEQLSLSELTLGVRWTFQP